MRVRTAHKGRNAGGQFWGCSKYPNCRGTASTTTNTGPANNTSGGLHTTATGPAKLATLEILRRKRVTWRDATTDRDGWTTRLVSAGGTLRAQPHPDAKKLATCWLARQTNHTRPDSEQPETSAAAGAEKAAALTAAVGTMQRLLARGVAPPMHPAAETLLLEGRHTPATTPTADTPTAGAATAGTSTAGTPHVGSARPNRDVGSVVPNRGPTMFADNMCGSSAEQHLVDIIEQHKPGAARWLIPQAPLDVLAAAAETETTTDGERRCDFLYSPPGGKPVIFEVDGRQHQTAKPADRERDRHAWKAGIDTIRIPVQELYAEHGERHGERTGKGLAAVLKAVDTAHQVEVNGSNRLLWGPVQTHRLVLGISEAIDAGYITGNCWVIAVTDPTGIAPGLVGPYLELLAAVLEIWDAGPAPETVVLRGQRTEIVYQHDPDRRFGYTRSDTTPEASQHGPATVQILLQSNWSPSETLPNTDNETPQIVIRSTGTPVLPTDPIRPRTNSRPVLTNKPGTKQAALETVMYAVFAKPTFRDGQHEALRSVLTGKDCAVLLPTGAGKSMIYQLAGMILPGRVLVIAPLVSLIDDQVRGLRLHGVDRVCGITSANSTRSLGVAEDGWFLYITPERFQRQPFRDLLAASAMSVPVNVVAIDEAHCVSEWGHDFRTAYLNLGRTVRKACTPTGTSPAPLVALTGTASRAVLTDVLFQLGINRDDPDRIIGPGSFDRPEIEYEVIRTKPATAQPVLQDTLRCLQAEYGQQTGTPTGNPPGIVFIPTVNGYHGLTDTLNAVHAVTVSAVGFSTKPPKGHNYNDWQNQKNENAEQFKTDNTAVIVSTKAFGMGIDKPNIRWIIHYGLPQSIESFYQEIGRAGRDHHKAKSVIVLSENNRAANKALLNPANRATQRPVARPAGRDDVSTVLWFHNQTTTAPNHDAEAVVAMYDTLQTGTHIPLGETDTDRDKAKRALHRLALLGVIDDYCIAGWGRTETAQVVMTGAEPDSIKAEFLGFVERSQPGRVGELRARLPEFADTRDAVWKCGWLLAEIVDETIGEARRRSLYEMWQLAGAGTSDGEAIRRGVLDYLSDGVPSATAQRLAERTEFAYADWLAEWFNATSNDARQWRAATARLLGSYPDHPGLLATRAVAAAYVPGGTTLDAFETEMALSIRNAVDRYQAEPADIEQMLLWALDRFTATDKPRHAAAVAQAAHAAPTTLKNSQRVDRWVRDHCSSNPHLAGLLLTEGLAEAQQITQRITQQITGQTATRKETS